MLTQKTFQSESQKTKIIWMIKIGTLEMVAYKRVLQDEEEESLTDR